MGGSIEPDTVVVVGGVEFKEYSQHLSMWSDYFNRGLKSGMQEAATKRFEFPHRDPKEWEMITTFVTPFARNTVTFRNVFILVSWFDELCSAKGMSICDEFLSSTMTSYHGKPYRGNPYEVEAFMMGQAFTMGMCNEPMEINKISTVMEIVAVVSIHGAHFPLTKKAILEFVKSRGGKSESLQTLLGP